MSLHQEKTRTYTYKVSIDDRRAMRKIHRLQILDSGYHITEVHQRNIPNSGARYHWGFKYYKSTEMRDFETGNVTGGTIPGLHEYRYSFDWEPTPNTELLEMRHANGGGTKIKGEQHLGSDDPRIPNYLPINMTVPWTPKEIKAMFNGETVPNKVDYSHDPPEIEASEARKKYRRLIEMATDDAFKEARKKVHEFEKNCDHQHAIKDKRDRRGGYCEDCGKEWHHAKEMEEDEVNIVGTA